VNVVNAVDIWLSDDPHFELGKVGLSLVANAREINRIMFAKPNNEYILALLQSIRPYFNHANPHIALDEAVHSLKKTYFKANKPDDTLSNLVSAFMVSLLTRYKDRMSIAYKGYKGILTYNIGNVSVVGNDFLVANPDFDFFMDVTSRKTVSFRSNGKVDVSKIAKALAGGGGHPNASGGMLTGFKDSFVYDRIRIQVKELIAKNEEK
jgi:oligoribonuclease NrnB/cAMP/cGMP phosphodiesterase (DHH superfamily)